MTTDTLADTKRDAIRAQVEGAFGFVPNVVSEMLESPAATAAYLAGAGEMAEATLTGAEQQVINVAISRRNGCKYCQAAHTALAKAKGVSPADLTALKAGDLPGDVELANLVSAAELLLEKQGHLGAGDLKELEDQGITREKVYEIIALIALKTITNWVNHIANTKINEQFGDA